MAKRWLLELGELEELLSWSMAAGISSVCWLSASVVERVIGAAKETKSSGKGTIWSAKLATGRTRCVGGVVWWMWVTGGKAARGEMPRVFAMAVERWRCEQRIMGRSREEWVEGRNAMCMEDGRQRRELTSVLEREWRAAAEGEGESSKGRADGWSRERMLLTVVMGRKPALA
jgi:hypothetical protein